MQKILIADDDSHLREVVSFALEKAGYSVLQAADGQSALTLCARHQPDLVVLDILMPEMDGLEVCREIRAVNPVPIVFLSSKDEEIDRVIGLEMGADDYIVKPFSPRELVARVRANLRRVLVDRSVEPQILEVGALRINSDSYEVQWNGTPLSLTHTEFCLLETLARRPDKVLSRDALMRGAYDSRRVVSDRTIDSHIRRLRDKLSGAGAPGIKTIHGVGYRLQLP